MNTTTEQILSIMEISQVGKSRVSGVWIWTVRLHWRVFNSDVMYIQYAPCRSFEFNDYITGLCISDWNSIIRESAIDKGFNFCVQWIEILIKVSINTIFRTGVNVVIHIVKSSGPNLHHYHLPFQVLYTYYTD